MVLTALMGGSALLIGIAWWLVSALVVPQIIGSSTEAVPGASIATIPAVATSSPAPTPTAPTPTATSPSPSPLLDLDVAELGVAGSVAVAAYDITSSTVLTAGSGSYETASVVKVDILVCLLVQREGYLTTSQKRLATSMITISDNAAASSLFQAIGGSSGMNATNAAIGLVETTAGTSGNWGLTTTTAADQLRLLQLVFVPNDVLGEESREYVRLLMGSVSSAQDWGVTAADDDGLGWAVKNGWLPRSTTGLWDVTSIGRVQTSGHDLLLVVLVNRATSEAAGIATIETAAQAAATMLVAA